MTTSTGLENQAIQAAKDQNWSLAAQLNEQITEQNPTDIKAFNRLGVSYAQIGQVGQAKKAFEQVLEIDKSNGLARKHLDKLKNHQPITTTVLPTHVQFIEEPGKTKTVDLHRLAGKDQLSKISLGQTCELKPKSRFISVEVEKTYVGSLPDDVSARLTKLIKDGNEYACYIRSISPTACSVFIKESQRSKKNEYVNSFSVNRAQLSALNDVFLTNDTLPLQMEDIPPQIVSTDADEEKTLDNLPMDEPMEETPAEPEEV